MTEPTPQQKRAATIAARRAAEAAEQKRAALQAAVDAALRNRTAVDRKFRNARAASHNAGVQFRDATDALARHDAEQAVPARQAGAGSGS